MKRNRAGTLKVFAFNRTTNAPVTGDAANITCKVQLDGGSRTALTDTNPTEQEDGYYLFDVAAAEANGTTQDFYPESSTSGVQVIVCEHNRYTDDARFDEDKLSSTNGVNALSVTAASAHFNCGLIHASAANAMGLYLNSASSTVIADRIQSDLYDGVSFDQGIHLLVAKSIHSFSHALECNATSGELHAHVDLIRCGDCINFEAVGGKIRLVAGIVFCSDDLITAPSGGDLDMTAKIIDGPTSINNGSADVVIRGAVICCNVYVEFGTLTLVDCKVLGNLAVVDDGVCKLVGNTLVLGATTGTVTRVANRADSRDGGEIPAFGHTQNWNIGDNDADVAVTKV